MQWSHSNRFLLSAGDGRVEHFWKSSSCFKESDLHWEWGVRGGEKSAEIKGASAGFAFAVTPATSMAHPAEAALCERNVLWQCLLTTSLPKEREMHAPYERNSPTLHWGTQGLGWGSLLRQVFYRRHQCHSSPAQLFSGAVPENSKYCPPRVLCRKLETEGFY